MNLDKDAGADKATTDSADAKTEQKDTKKEATDKASSAEE